MRTYEFPSTANATKLKALREEGYYQLDFWRQVPPPLWKALAKDDKFWMIETIGAARGLAKPKTICLMDTLTADEQLALFRLATSGARVTVSYHNAKKALATFAALAVTAEQVVGLVASCDKSQGTQHLFGAFTPAQIEHAKRAYWMKTAAKAKDAIENRANTAARWFYITQTDVTAEEFDALADVPVGEVFSTPWPADAKAYAGLRTRLAGALREVRAWVEQHVDSKWIVCGESHDDFYPLWGVALTGAADELIARIGAVLEENKDDYRSERSREKLATRLAQALVCRDDGDEVLAALDALTKSKGLRDTYDAAGELLTGMLGQAGKGAVSWATLKPDEGAAILRASTDPKRTVEEALAKADANTALRLFQAVTWYGCDERPSEAFGGLWAMIEKTLVTLDRALDDSTPAELVRDNFDNKVSTDEAFTWAMQIGINTLGSSKHVAKPMDEDDVIAKLRAMHAKSKNPRFRGLLSELLGESYGDKLVRLAAAAATKDTVTRNFVVRTDTAPGAKDINRLYGSPIGITAKTWPRTKKKKPMQHILTLETRLLSEAAQESLGSIAAVAVFLADIDKPYGESAIVFLTAAAVKKVHAPVVKPVIEGQRLAPLELALPKAVFQGGKKTGPLKELRVALDRLDGVLSTDHASADWIQEPEPDGPLIAQLDGNFAPKLNFGDVGAIYVQVGGVVFQCH